MRRLRGSAVAADSRRRGRLRRADAPAAPARTAPGHAWRQRAAPTTTGRRARARWVPASWSRVARLGRRPHRASCGRRCWRGCGKPAAGLGLAVRAARALQPADDAAGARLAAAQLQPYRVEALDGAGRGPGHRLLRAAGRRRRVPRGAQQIALLRPPADLATRKPWWTRAQLDTVPAARPALRGREIAFVADPLDALLLQVQGSGRLRRDRSRWQRSGSLRLAYAGHNDQPYQSVGRWLIEQGELRGDEASWPAIRDWARRYPERVNELLWSNPRVVFFREEPLPDAGRRPARRAGRAADADPLDRGRSAGVPYGTHAVARHHRAAGAHAAAPRGDGAGHRQRHHRRGARRLLLGLGRRRPNSRPAA